MKFFKIIFYNIFVFFIAIILVEIVFGSWFKKDNFGIYMRKERKINWQTKSSFYGDNYSFYYKRNYWGFRGENFDPKDVQIIFEGGSTGNERLNPEKFTIVGLLNEKFKSINKETKIYNASTDGKAINGYINDFNFWFPKIPNLKPKYVIFYIGINDTTVSDKHDLDNKTDRYYLNYKISKKKVDQLKDYIKNNSFFIDKFISTKNKYFPKDTLAYDLSDKLLYNNFEFIDFQKALSLHKNLDKKDLDLIKKFRFKLIKLQNVIVKYKITPIFISQLKFDGLRDKDLFLANNELKNFARENKYFVIPIDEILLMDKYDYYDRFHTTPKGSKKIADAIFPYLVKFLN
jgi:lysophospholipase L1-like esterase